MILNTRLLISINGRLGHFWNRMLLYFINSVTIVVLLNFDLSCVTRVCCLVFRHAHYRNREEELNMAVS